MENTTKNFQNFFLKISKLLLKFLQHPTSLPKKSISLIEQKENLFMLYTHIVPQNQTHSSSFETARDGSQMFLNNANPSE